MFSMMNTSRTSNAGQPEMADTVALINVIDNGSQPCDPDNVQSVDHTTVLSCNAQDKVPQLPPKSIQSDSLLSRALQSPNAANNTSQCFEEILEEVNDEEPIFNPFPFIDENSDVLIDIPLDKELIGAAQSDFPETLDDFLDSGEQQSRHLEIDTEMVSGEPSNPSETNSKAKGHGDSEVAVEPPERTSNTHQDVTDEDSEEFGGLPISIADQHPCFNASSDRNRIEFDDDLLLSLHDFKEASVGSNLLTVGTLPEIEELQGLEQEQLPKPGPKHTFRGPTSTTVLFPNISNMTDPEKQGENTTVKQSILAARAANFSVIGREENALDPSKQTPQAVPEQLDSHCAGNFPAPRTTAISPAPVNMQPLAFGLDSNAPLSVSRNQRGLLESRGTPLSRIEPMRNSRPNLDLNTPLLLGNVPRQVYSLSDVTSERQSKQLQFLGNPQHTSFTHESTGTGLPAENAPVAIQPNPMHNAPHKRSAHQRSLSGGEYRPHQDPRFINLFAPMTLHNDPNHSTKGQQRHTPTSIFPQEIPFQFQERAQPIGNSSLLGEAQSFLFDTDQMRANASMGKKRKIGEVGGSCQVPSKKARNVTFNIQAQKRNANCLDVSLQTSRITQTLQPHQSPNLSTYGDPAAISNLIPLTAGVQTESFVTGQEAPPGIGLGRSTEKRGILQNMGGTPSEATISSPSKPRSTNVRDESGQFPKRFICKECPEAFAFKENCDRHFKVVHQKRTVYFCYHCQASYLQAKTMRLHVEKKHHKIDGENSTFPCYWCEFKTNTDSAWSRHVSEKHPGHKNKFRGNGV